MIDLLERFKENEIQNKDDLLYSLGSMYDNFDSDASAPQARKELLEKFIKHIDAMQLPRCDDWWFYSYDFTRFGMVLDLCHCAEFAVESDDEFTMTVDESLAIAEVTCDMMTVDKSASLTFVPDEKKCLLFFTVHIANDQISIYEQIDPFTGEPVKKGK